MRLLWLVPVTAWFVGASPGLAQTDPNVPGPAQRGAVGGLMVPGVPMPVGPPWYTDPRSGSNLGGTGPGLTPATVPPSTPYIPGARAEREASVPGKGVIFMPRPYTPGTAYGPSYGGTSGGPGTTAPPTPPLPSSREGIPSMGNPGASDRTGRP